MIKTRTDTILSCNQTESCARKSIRNTNTLSRKEPSKDARRCRKVIFHLLFRQDRVFFRYMQVNKMGLNYSGLHFTVHEMGEVYEDSACSVSGK